MPVPEKLHTNILRRIIITMQLVTAFPALKVAAISVLFDCESAFTASLTSVLCIHLFHIDTPFFSFVLYVFVECFEGPAVEHLLRRKIVSDVFKVFESDYIHIMADGFFDEFFGDLV